MIWVPHFGQKLREAVGEDWNVVVSPEIVNDEIGTVNQATNGAPVVRRQIEQWQAVSCDGLAALS
nr:hypothetical protein [Reyranella massiliensis]